MHHENGTASGLNRRDVLRIVAVTGAAGVFGFYPFIHGNSRFHAIRKSRPMMGTILNLTVYAQDREQAETAVTATFDRMQALEEKLSRHKTDSEVVRLNRAGLLDNPSSELIEVLELAETISRKTAGSFDVTMLPLLRLYQEQGQELLDQPGLVHDAVKKVSHEKVSVDSHLVQLDGSGMGITLDGIGKGYIVDQGAQTLMNFGFDQVLVEAGGDLLVKGGKPSGNPWRVGIRNPRPDMSRELVTIETDSMAIATSGDYFQSFSPDLLLHHIINPHTGFSSPDLASCTITAPFAALADALATACMVLGLEDSIDLLAAMPGCEGYFIGKNLAAHKTDGFTG